MKHIGNLSIAEGSTHKKKRIGRGPGSGHGGTSTRGHKGQKSRAGASIRPGFEGGQMALNRRVPKFGFFNRSRIEYQVINVKTLQELHDNNRLSDSKVDFDTLLALGMIDNKRKPVKILGDGELTAAINVTADKFTKSAKEKIESVGGTVTINV